MSRRALNAGAAWRQRWDPQDARALVRLSHRHARDPRHADLSPRLPAALAFGEAVRLARFPGHSEDARRLKFVGPTGRVRGRRVRRRSDAAGIQRTNDRSADSPLSAVDDGCDADFLCPSRELGQDVQTKNGGCGISPKPANPDSKQCRFPGLPANNGTPCPEYGGQETAHHCDEQPKKEIARAESHRSPYEGNCQQQNQRQHVAPIAGQADFLSVKDLGQRYTDHKNHNAQQNRSRTPPWVSLRPESWVNSQPSEHHTGEPRIGNTAGDQVHDEIRWRPAAIGDDAGCLSPNAAGNKAAYRSKPHTSDQLQRSWQPQKLCTFHQWTAGDGHHCRTEQ